jgi:3-phosphoshikimate 1-carboxyvinyltransferase
LALREEGAEALMVTISGADLRGEVKAPPSKSYTHRAVTAALLSEGRSEILDPLFSKDTEATMLAAELFGALIERGGERLLVEGRRRPVTPGDVVDAMNSGTTLRIMTALAGLAEGGYTVLTGDESLRRRPMQPLLDALGQLGVRAWSTRLNGTAPIVVEAGNMGGECRIRGDISSQYISALLMAGAAAERPVTVQVEGEPVSRPYIESTIAVMKEYGAWVTREGYTLFHTEPAGYRAARFRVPGDYGLAGFIMAAPLLGGGRVRVTGLDPRYPQADRAVVALLAGMGAKIRESAEAVEVEWTPLRGLETDLRDSPDLLPIAAVLGSVAEGETRIKGVHHARHKESDRISVLASELRKASIQVEERADGLVIRGGRPRRATLDPQGDHRLFMAFALLSLSTPGGLNILNPESASVSYPSFLDDLRRIGCEVRPT